MDDDDRLLTKEEKWWAVQLLRCLNKMPRNIEICVTYSGTVEVRNLGADKRYFDEHGHTDNVISLDTVIPKKSVRERIDGLDSSI